MTIRLNDKYGVRANAANSEYPDGSFKNATTPLTGTPVDKDWQNDWAAFFQKLLVEANITANGTVDTVLSSQLFQAFTILAARGGNSWLSAESPTDTVMLGGTSVYNIGGAFIGSTVVSLGYYNSSTYNALVSTNSGATWTRSSATAFDKPTGIAAGAGVFAVISSGTSITTKVYYSSDGVTWSESTDIFSDDQEYSSLIFDGTNFIAGCNDGYVNTSADAITWSEVSIPLPNVHGIEHNGDNVVIATGDPKSVTGERIMRSTNNGASWTEISTPDDSIPYRGIAYGNGRWVAFPTESGTAKNEFAYSDDEGLTWTIASMPSQQYDCIVYTPLGFLAPYTDTEQRIMQSADGLTWYSVFIPEAEFLGASLSKPFIDSSGRTYIGAGGRMLLSGV